MTGLELLRAALGVALALLLVLGLAAGFIWLLRRLQDRQAGSRSVDPQSRITFVRALPLGPRERAVLVDVEGERLLLGVSAGGVSLLARWPRGLRANPADAPDLGDEARLAASSAGPTMPEPRRIGMP